MDKRPRNTPDSIVARPTSSKISENTDFIIDPVVVFVPVSVLFVENVLRLGSTSNTGTVLVKSHVNDNDCGASKPLAKHKQTEPGHSSESVKEPALIKMVLEENSLEDDNTELPSDTEGTVEDAKDFPPIDQETIFEHQQSDVTESEEESDEIIESETDNENLYYNKDDSDYEPDDGHDQTDSDDYDPEEDEKIMKKPKRGAVKKGRKKPEKTYQCDLCGLCYKGRGSYDYHVISKHTEDRPFECDQCPQRFKFKYNLKSHVSYVHNGGYKLACKLCNKIISRRVMPKHIKIHLGIKPHKCEICEKCFSKREHLKTHMLVHTGEKPFSCTICDRKFSLKGNLRTHLKTQHTHEKPLDHAKNSHGVRLNTQSNEKKKKGNNNKKRKRKGAFKGKKREK